jgi:long-chain fatty acid transport protein
MGRDASTAWHNPAGMTRIEGREFMLAGGLIYSTIHFDRSPATPISGGNGGDAGGFAPLMGAYYVQSISERLKFGLDVISIAGSALDHHDSWTGRYQVQNLSLLTMTFNPSLAYKATDKLSVAAGLGAVYGNIDYELAAPPPIGNGQIELDGDDWAFGYSFSAMYEATERTRLGAIYWSEVGLDYSGDLEFRPLGLTAGTDTDLPLAQWVKAGIYHEINDKWALLGTVGWEDWSVLDKITVSTGSGGAALPTNWKDTYHFAGGFHYRPCEDWLFKAGIAYDTSCVDSDDRVAYLPIDRQWRYSLGVEHQVRENLTVGGAITYIDLGDAKINKPLLRGDYDRNNILMVGLHANWKF